MNDQTPKDYYVYTIHFDKVVGRKLHYSGITHKDNLRQRMLRHARGYGANLTRRAWQQGARLWLVSLIEVEGWADEQRVKRRNHAKDRCSICTPNTRYRKFSPREIDHELRPVPLARSVLAWSCAPTVNDG